MVRLFAIGLATFLASSCISADWNRSVLHEPLDEVELSGLEIGDANLTDCLAALGAPIRVWEIGDGAALAWYWLDSNDKGASLSVPTGEALSANFTFGSVSNDAEGALLMFDSDWQLVDLRRGQINEILPEHTLRPALVEPL